ncbi:MAG: hypothetical protein HY566_01220, partial [Candidatus Kerfeldbacteria bacterium]|nr:hypothetical protein [Candidatus Kerfeldbacteria bacterium]
MPRSLPAFTYSIPESLDTASLAVGCWVRIPFRGQLLDGVVLRKRKVPPGAFTRILPIRELLEIPPLTPSQLRIAGELARTNAVAISTAVRTMLPSRPRRSTDQTSSPPTPLSQRVTGLSLSKTRLHLLQRRAKNMPGASCVFIPAGAPAERIVWLLTLLSRIRDKQQLVVVPTRA